jgi:hypothetical protein
MDSAQPEKKGQWSDEAKMMKMQTYSSQYEDCLQRVMRFSKVQYAMEQGMILCSAPIFIRAAALAQQAGSGGGALDYEWMLPQLRDQQRDADAAMRWSVGHGVGILHSRASQLLARPSRSLFGSTK